MKRGMTRATHCYCTARLNDEKACPYGCPPKNPMRTIHRPVGVRAKAETYLSNEEASAGEKRAGNTAPYSDPSVRRAFTPEAAAKSKRRKLIKQRAESGQ